MRVVLFFAFFLSCVGVPFLLAFLFGAFKTRDALDPEAFRVEDGKFVDVARAAGREPDMPPTDVRTIFPKTTAAAMAIFRDGSRTLLLKYPSSSAAAGGMQYLASQMGS